MLIFGGSALAVLVGFAGLYAALSWVAGTLTTDPESDGTLRAAVDQGGNPVTTLALAEPVVVAPVDAVADLDWYAIDSALGHSTRLLASDNGSFYALSTIPGNAAAWPIPKAIYKSADGESWDIISLDESMSGHDMALRGGTIYLIGTSPATQSFQDPAEVLISASSDDGQTWTQAMLPTSSEPPGGAPIEFANVSMRIGASRDVIVAVVNSQYNLDYRRLVPDEFAQGGFGFQPEEDGVQVIDYRSLEQMFINCENEAANAEQDSLSPECEALFNGDESAGSVGFVTWEEMGLPPGGRPAFSEMFISSDGETFEAVESPFTPGGDLSAFHASDAGFVGVEWSPAAEFADGQQVWWSADGQEWELVDGLQAFDWINNVGTVAGNTVVVGQARNGPIAAWQSDAGGWDQIDFNDVVGGGGNERFLSTAAVGPLGVVAVFQSFDELAGRDTVELAIGSSPQDWSLIRVDEIVGLGGGYSDWAAVGTDQIILRYEVFNEFRPRSLQVIGAVVDS